MATLSWSARYCMAASRLGFDTPETDLHTLASCCLLHVNPDDTVSMHDQLRDMAYSIVREEGGILQRSRWRVQDVIQGYKVVQPLSTCARFHAPASAYEASQVDPV